MVLLLGLVACGGGGDGGSASSGGGGVNPPPTFSDPDQNGLITFESIIPAT